MEKGQTTAVTAEKKKQKSKLSREIARHRSVYLLALIPMIYYIIFKYVPIWNAQIAFKDFKAVQGVVGSAWIGFENFKEFFNSFYFWSLLRNTIMYSVGKLLISLPLSILLAIAIYECTKYKVPLTIGAAFLFFMNVCFIQR